MKWFVFVNKEFVFIYGVRNFLWKGVEDGDQDYE